MVQNKQFYLSKTRIVLLLANYFIGYMKIYPILLATITLWIDPYANQIPVIINFIFHMFMIVSTIWLAYPLLKLSYQKWKSYGAMEWFRFILKTMVTFYFCLFLLNFIISIWMQDQSSQNQMQVVEQLQNQQLFTSFLTVLYAPIVEEVIFRGVLFYCVKSRFNYVIAAVVSTLSFGLLHIWDALLQGSFQELIFLLPYSLTSFFFVYGYQKTDSIFTSMMMHFLNNAIATLLLIFA